MRARGLLDVVVIGAGAVGAGVAGALAQADFEVALVEPQPPATAPEDAPLDILYEDDQLIVIDKPLGLVVHPAPGNWTGTLVNALIHHCGPSLKGIGGVKRPGIVHRLDKDTTGVMVAAKTELALKGLAAQFADHGRTGPLHRAYTAFVWGSTQSGRGTAAWPPAPATTPPGWRGSPVRQWFSCHAAAGAAMPRTSGRRPTTSRSAPPCCSKQ